MTRRLVILVMTLLSIATPAAAQASLDLSTPAAVTAAAAVRPLSRLTTATLIVEPDPTRRSPFKIRPAWRASNGAVTQGSRRRSKAPIVGGMLLGAIAGFLGGNYLQHSFCEYDCGPGGFTWGFTAIGAVGGAAIGFLLR